LKAFDELAMARQFIVEAEVAAVVADLDDAADVDRTRLRALEELDEGEER